LNYRLHPDVYGTDSYPPGDMEQYAKGDGRSASASAFTQSSFRLNSRLTANIGVHGTYFHLTGKASVEPRIGIRWQAAARHAFGVAYGKHSRRESTDCYFVETPAGAFPNKRLDFAKAHHAVMSYDWSVSEHLRLKVEPYFQYLYDIPAERGSTVSLINYNDVLTMLPALANDGKGRNYGVDLTLERYLHEGYYYLTTASLFSSRYAGGDGVWRNTRLNRNFIINALGGKEWKVGRQRQNMLNVSVRFTFQGGERYIPFDMAASQATKTVVFDYSRAYEPQQSPDFICHFTFGFKMNRDKLSHEFSVKMLNVTGNKEYGNGYFYNHKADKPETGSGAIVLPSVGYKLEF
jgi:hypothetical protein